MKKMKSLMLFTATMLLLAVVFCINASAAEWIAFDTNAQYTFDKETAVMVIKGEGSLDGSYFSEICPDHYAPKYDGFGCSCQLDQDWDPPEDGHPGYFDAKATKTLIIQEGITAIDIRAFYYFSSLEVAILPQSLTEIPAGAFSDLKKLNTVVLSNSIATIGEAAFYNCTNLKNVYMADTLKSVGKNAFYGCDRDVIRIPESATVEAEKPDSVKNVTVSAKEYEATITWDKSSKAEGYVVEFVGEGTGTEKEIKTQNTSLAISGLTPSKRYYVYVTPYLTYNGEVVYGDAPTHSFVTKPEAPKVSVKEISSDKITISWSDNNDYVCYRIYIKNDNGAWVSLGVLSDDEYGNDYEFRNLKPGTTYSFAVRPIRPNGALEVLGDYTTINATTKALAPTKVTAAQNTSAIKLTWTKCEGATGYRIYYKSGSTWKVALSTTTATSYTFSGLKAGAKYTFAIRPYSLDSGTVIWSDYTEFTTATLPATVTAKVSSPSAGKITLTWNAVSGADGYQVYYKINNGSYKLYKVYTGVQNLTFGGLDSNATYTFAVRAGIITSGGNIFGGYNDVSLKPKSNKLTEELVYDLWKTANTQFDNWRASINRNPYVDSSKTYNIGSMPYYRIDHPTIKSIVALNKEMSKYFDETICENIMSVYKDYNGNLYAHAGGRGSMMSYMSDMYINYQTDNFAELIMVFIGLDGSVTTKYQGMIYEDGRWKFAENFCYDERTIYGGY